MKVSRIGRHHTNRRLCAALLCVCGTLSAETLTWQGGGGKEPR